MRFHRFFRHLPFIGEFAHGFAIKILSFEQRTLVGRQTRQPVLHQFRKARVRINTFQIRVGRSQLEKSGEQTLIPVPFPHFVRDAVARQHRQPVPEGGLGIEPPHMTRHAHEGDLQRLMRAVG